MCVVTRWHTRQWTANTSAQQHRATRTTWIGHESIAPYREFFVFSFSYFYISNGSNDNAQFLFDQNVIAAVVRQLIFCVVWASRFKPFHRLYMQSFIITSTDFSILFEPAFFSPSFSFYNCSRFQLIMPNTKWTFQYLQIEIHIGYFFIHLSAHPCFFFVFSYPFIKSTNFAFLY